MNENLPKMPAALAPAEPTKLEKKMRALRLSKAMTDLHEKAHDRGNPEEEGKQAAAALGMVVLKNFDLIIWALRLAGGARQP